MLSANVSFSNSPDTITAPVTAPGSAAVSVVRVSGPLTSAVVDKLVVRAKEVLSQPRKLIYSEINYDDTVLDRALVAYFRAPRSFSGEDSLEFHLHGSPFVVERLLKVLVSLGVRLAEPGEFSKRAFLNGQLDLVQAEAVADLIAAETACQANAASEQLDGRLSGAVSKLGEPLRECLAEIEAFIDFPDEDIEPSSVESWKSAISVVKSDICEYIDSFKTGRLYREGAEVAIVGYPNAGKSSLLNRLVGEQRAIVSRHPGTTRDAIEERISLDGLLVNIWDTAGLVDIQCPVGAPEEIEKIGVERSWSRLKHSDLALFVFDSTSCLSLQKELYLQVREHALEAVVVANKVDLLSKEDSEKLIRDTEPLFTQAPVFVSALSGAGFDNLRVVLRKALLGSGQSRNVMITNRRHYDSLLGANCALSGALSGIGSKLAPEFIASDIRGALNSLTDIVGLTSSEDILGRIFSKFCIGK